MFMFIQVSLFSVVLVSSMLAGTECLLRPSYISPWHTMDTADTSTLHVTFTHNFTEMPVYCDVQVRSPVTGFIYPGTGSGFIDDDEGERGGVLFYYDTVDVILMGALQTSSRGVAYVIFTGALGYLSDNGEKLAVADVRARLWKESDFPPPSYTVPEFNVYTYNMFAHSHPLASVPTMTVVQVYMTNGGPSGYVTQAQGSYADNTNSENDGGTLYGVNATSVVVWTLANVFNWCDGWWYSTTSSCRSTTASVVIRMWSCLESESKFSHTSSHSLYADNEPASHDVTITSEFNYDNDLVIVRAEATSGDYSGLYFDGMGAAITDYTTLSTNVYTGGLVYATHNGSQTFRLWHSTNYSSCSTCRCIIKVPDVCVEAVNVHITIVEGMATNYPESTSSPLHAYISLRQACYQEYTCNDAHVQTGGEMILTLVNGVWTGAPPTCVYCSTLDVGTNAILNLQTDVFGFATYTCKPGYDLVSGNLNRECLEMGLNTFRWSGSEPVCQAPTTTTTAAVTTTIPVTTATSITTTTPTTTTTPITTPMPTTTVSTTTSSVQATTLLGPVCFNITATSSPAVIEEAVKVAEEISKNLTVDVKTTNSFLRTLTSATDKRASALYVGLVGYLVFGLVFGLVVVIDVLSVVRYYAQRNSSD